MLKMTKKLWIIPGALFFMILSLGVISSSWECGLFSGEWECNDGTCIFSSWVCDGDCDCSSCEDESGCTPSPPPDECGPAGSSGTRFCGLGVCDGSYVDCICWYGPDDNLVWDCDSCTSCSSCPSDPDCVVCSCVGKDYCNNDGCGNKCYESLCSEGCYGWCCPYSCSAKTGDTACGTLVGTSCGLDVCPSGTYGTKCDVAGEVCSGGSSGTCAPPCDDDCLSKGYDCGWHLICGENEFCGDCYSPEPYCSGAGKCVECEFPYHCDPGEVCYNNACCIPDCDDSIWPCGTSWTGSDYCGGTCSGTGTWCPSGQSCIGGTCVTPCSEGSTRCEVDSYQTCIGNTWVTTDTCDSVRYQNEYCQTSEEYCSSISGCLWGSWINEPDGTICSETDFCSGDGYYTGKKCYSGTCVDSYGYTACADASCSSDGDGTYSALSDSTCNPATTTCTTQSSIDCGAYACSGTSCATSCTSDADCAGSYICDGGTCDLCTLSSASWSVASAREGDTVTLTVVGSHCAGKTITFKTYDNNNNLIDTLSNIYDSTNWVVEWSTGGSPYYFKALFATETATSNNLIVTACGDGVVNGGEDCDGSALGSCVQCDMDTVNDPETCVCAEYCGDSIVQSPNDDGFNEECDSVLGCTDCVWFPEGFWADSQGNEITTKAVVVWSTSINMILRYTGLASGTAVDFEIWEDDPWIFSKDYITTINDTIESAGAVTGVWIPTQEDMDKTSDYNKFFFIVKDGSGNEIETSGDLDITITEGDICEFISSCSDYLTEGECGSDAELCGVAETSVAGTLPDGAVCGVGGYECYCYWDSSECGPMWTYSGSCGDGVINPGEQCESEADLVGISCSDFDEFTGGDLQCTGCMIDTSLCTGGIDSGICGDGDVNIGEQCESEADLVGISCSDFDEFTGGDLQCTGCMIDTSLCTGGADGGEGSCKITQTVTNSCEEEPLKFMTYTWTGIWEGSPGGVAYDKCIAGGESTIECPAQIQLPFFDFYNVIATLVLIALIYISLIFKRKKN